MNNFNKIYKQLVIETIDSCNIGKFVPMTLDEAIEHAEERMGDNQSACQKQHGQLVAWLKELKEFRAKAGIDNKY